MKAAVIILGLIALASAAPKASNLGFRNLYKQPIKPITTKPGPRIIGGQEVTPHSIPWQAFLEVYSSSEGWYCGGSLLSENYVVTAGHCGDGARQAQVTLGAHKPLQDEDTQIVVTSTDVTVHEGYDGDEIINDIAVIRVSGVALSSAIQPVKLPSNANDDYAGQTATASGWGLTNGHGTTISSVLNSVDLKVISHSECEDIFGSLRDSILCTSGDQNTGTCSGDSGGPLAIDGVLIGVTSFGVQYCPGGYPSAFTRVTSFLDWLQRNSDVKLA